MPNGPKSTTVTIEKYIDKQVCALTEIMEQRFEDVDKATNLKAAELNAHLESLNNSYAFIRESQARIVGREVFDAKMEILEHRFTAIEKWQSNIEGRIIATAAGISILIPLIIMALNYFLTGTK